MKILVPLQQIETLRKDYCSSAADHWSVQIFSSINSDSANFNLDSPSRLKKKKGRTFDNSLQCAYIHQIRRARRCIYIENHYFMVSSHMWESRDVNIGNLAPIEITLKIVEKIKAKERFVAYTVIPMFPEGKPKDIVRFHIYLLFSLSLGTVLNDPGGPSTWLLA